MLQNTECQPGMAVDVILRFLAVSAVQFSLVHGTRDLNRYGSLSLVLVLALKIIEILYW